MSLNHRNQILCPVDLNVDLHTTIELATAIAIAENSILNFVYVFPQWLPEQSMLAEDYLKRVRDECKYELSKLRPADVRVEFIHTFLEGNPGAEIVKASAGCAAIVMATQGHGVFMRLLMGSVASYVLRHAKCPVILYKPNSSNSSQEKPQHLESSEEFVTKRMNHARPIHASDNMNETLEMFQQTGESAAPVIDGRGKCIGILTQTDIEDYQELKRRYEAQDHSVISEMFEMDKFGHVRCENIDFDQVNRHMTSPVITIANSASMEAAEEVFKTNQNIHHLVVLDESKFPVGILDLNEIAECKSESTTGNTTKQT